MGRLEHFGHPPFTESPCPVCQKFANDLQDRHKRVSQLSLRDQTPQKEDGTIFGSVLKFVVQRSDCMLLLVETNQEYDSDGRIPANLELIRNSLGAVELSNREKGILISVIEKKGVNTLEGLKKDWFEPLSRYFEVLPTRKEETYQNNVERRTRRASSGGVLPKRRSNPSLSSLSEYVVVNDVQTYFLQV
jgi:hypothetical protein